MTKNIQKEKKRCAYSSPTMAVILQNEYDIMTASGENIYTTNDVWGDFDDNGWLY